MHWINLLNLIREKVEREVFFERVYDKFIFLVFCFSQTRSGPGAFFSVCEGFSKDTACKGQYTPERVHGAEDLGSAFAKSYYASTTGKKIGQKVDNVKARHKLSVSTKQEGKRPRLSSLQSRLQGVNIKLLSTTLLYCPYPKLYIVPCYQRKHCSFKRLYLAYYSSFKAQTLGN